MATAALAAAAAGDAGSRSHACAHLEQRHNLARERAQCAKLARRSLTGIEAIFWLTLVEMCVAMVCVKIAGESFWPASKSGFLVPLFLAIIVQVLGQGLIITGLGSTPASIAGVLVVVQPVVAAAIAWSLFDEPLTALQLGGGLLILLAIWLSQLQKPKPVNQT